MPSKTKTNVSQKSRVTKNTRAGLAFPITKINRKLVNSGWTERVGAQTAVWLAGSCQYLLEEIIDLSAQTCKLAGRKRITCRDITLAIRNDECINRVLANHRSYVGDKIKKVSDEFTIEADKRYMEKVKKMKGGEEV